MTPEQSAALALLRAQQSAQWEVAKGHLRAAVALRGHQRALGDVPELAADDGKAWLAINERIERFIADVDNMELFT